MFCPHFLVRGTFLRCFSVVFPLLLILGCGGGGEAPTDDGSPSDRVTDSEPEREIPPPIEQDFVPNRPPANLAEAHSFATIHLRANRPLEAVAVLESALEADTTASDFVRSQAESLLYRAKQEAITTAKLPADGSVPEPLPETIPDPEPTPQPVPIVENTDRPEPPASTEMPTEPVPGVDPGEDSETEVVDATIPDPTLPPLVIPKPPEDAEPVEKVSAENLAIGQALRAAKQARTARDALEILEQFHARHTFTEKQKANFEDDLALWRERVEKDLIRSGIRWLTAEEIAENTAEAESLIDQAMAQLGVENYEETRRLLEKASSVHPGGTQADFLLGVLNSARGYAFPKVARQHFKEVTIRNPRDVSAMNNQALAEIRLGNYLDALLLWRESAKLAPRTPEVCHNLGRFVTLARTRRLSVQDRLIDRFDELYKDLIVSGHGQPFDNTRGWLYMPMLSTGADVPNDPNVNLVAMSSGSGFVIDKGYLLTNRHVIQNEETGAAHIIRVVDPADAKLETELVAEVVAMSDDLDLALLRCPDLEAEPLPLLGDYAARGEEVLVLGYPRGDLLGRGVKTTRGIVASRPVATFGGMMLFDAEANPGNSGGPIFNRRGEVIAVMTVKLNQEKLGAYTGGIPTPDVFRFVKEHLPNLRPPAEPGEPLEWSAVDQAAAPSTVMLISYERGADLNLPGKAGSVVFLEDSSCVRCYGGQRVHCPDKKCIQGAISVKTPYTQMIRVGQEMKQITRFRFVKQRCTTCGGDDIITCPHCSNGDEPTP